MEWFKHKTASHEDPDISDAFDLFGDCGYTIFFITLEIYGREFKRLDKDGNLIITKKYLTRKLRKRWTKVEEVWNFYQGRDRFQFESKDDFISLRIPKFIELASNWSKRKKPPTEVPTEPPTAIELELDLELEEKGLGGRVEGKKGNKKIVKNILDNLTKGLSHKE